MYTRMTIVEAISDEQAREVRNLMDAHSLDLPYLHTNFVSSQRLSEDGGNMIVFETTWLSREACVRYHSSRHYRQLVAAIQHFLVGEPVVKLFAQFSTDEKAATVTTRIGEI